MHCTSRKVILELAIPRIESAEGYKLGLEVSWEPFLYVMFFSTKGQQPKNFRVCLQIVTREVSRQISGAGARAYSIQCAVIRVKALIFYEIVNFVNC
jgi:hypothetical protein